MIFKGEAGASVAAREVMQLGKILTLGEAARQLEEVDKRFTDLRWALRFCLEAEVKICISLPYSINTWERRKQPDIGERCGRCGDISDERDLCMYEDAEEEDKPQYCENCHMTKPPVMGYGDYIGQRWGVLVVASSEIADLIMPNVDAASVSKLFDIDESWSGGYCRFEIASERDVKRDELESFEREMKDNGFTDEFDIAATIEAMRKDVADANKERFLRFGLSDLWVYKEDFEQALDGVEDKSRKDSPMNEAFDSASPQEPHLYLNNLSSSKQNEKRERSGAANDFVELGVVAYESAHGSYPEKLSQLLLFAKKVPNPVSGYVLIDEGKGNGRRIFFSIAKSHRESATYQGIRDAFKAWKSKNKHG